jgi:hypothetical protein
MRAGLGLGVFRGSQDWFSVKKIKKIKKMSLWLYKNVENLKLILSQVL